MPAAELVAGCRRAGDGLLTGLLTLPELDAALAAIGGFEPRPLVAVGVSGGPDSMALALLADRWARARGGTAWGLIVDHGLRPESAAEAATVAGWLAGRGIPHAVLAWRGAKPATGIQEAARTARYRLLADWCAAQGCLHLLLAHHREDQGETYLIRRRAGSGIDGLAAMSAVRELGQLRIVRPLLAVAKARLAALLEAEGQPWLQDPSNRNPAFERVRWRNETDAATVADAAAAARRSGRVRVAREHELAALLARAVALHPGGFAVLDPEPIAAAGECGELALGRVAAVLGGGFYPLRRERLSRLRLALGELPCRARTLGGCRFVPWRGRVLVLREAARAAPPLCLAPGECGVWDRRFAVSLPATAPGPVSVGPLGEAGLAALPPRSRESKAPGADISGADGDPLPRLVYPSLPAVWDACGLAVVPHLGWCRATSRCGAQLAFHPAVSLFGTGFTVV